MSWRALCSGVAICALATAGCGSNATPSSPSSTPTSPSSTPLTLTAPSAVSPVNGVLANSLTPTLVLRASAGSNTSTTVSYQLEVIAPNGSTVYTRTLNGGAADGQATISHQVESSLARWTTYRWRARAVAGSTTSPWSDASAAVTFVTTRPSASTSTDEFREYFFDLINQKGVGPNASQLGLATMEPDLTAAGVILAKNEAGSIRGRIYLPTGTSNKYGRSVDVVGSGWGTPWVWVYRGATICEGICP